MTDHDPTVTPAHLAATTTDRGFAHMPPLGDVSVAESSAASGPHLWLSITDRPAGPVQGVAHLTAEHAWQLKEQIEHLLEHHYQGDARPGHAAVVPRLSTDAALGRFVRGLVHEGGELYVRYPIEGGYSEQHIELLAAGTGHHQETTTR